MKHDIFLTNSNSLHLIIILSALSPQFGSASESSRSLDGQEAVELSPMVVTAPEPNSAWEAVLDAKVPYQPIPSQDGADFLKSVPGFAVIRKGGTDGDPLFRGMAGSRLGISLDGQSVLGGCGNRMDPPTAYVFPASYDRVTIHKGPQTVRYGAGSSAGVVRFETEPRRFADGERRLDSSLTFGAFGRLDASFDGAVGNPRFFARVAASRTESDDYQDGGGQSVHSRHLRWSANATLGWTPDDTTLLQYTAIRSDGKAAYADRMMDGAAFERESHQLSWRRDVGGELLKAVDVELGYSYIDHAMDNYTLRLFVPNMMMPSPMVSNPDRRTVGGRARLDFEGSPAMEYSLGLDFQENRHTTRSSMNEATTSVRSLPRIRDAEFEQYGIFGEFNYTIGEGKKLYTGARLDRWRAMDGRDAIALGMMGGEVNPTAGAERETDLASGFVRYEAELGELKGSYFLGIGRVERFLDYWELVRYESEDSLSAFGSRPEKTTQLDLGAIKRFGAGSLTVTAFYNQIDDYALIQSEFAKPSGMMGVRSATVARSIDARSWGGEAALAWRLGESWQVDASLAYVRGQNLSDDLALAQIAPLESRLSVAYQRSRWSVGALLRAVAAQDRIAIGQGNIVGQDLGPSSGFAVVSLNGSTQLSDRLRWSAGIDNVLGKEYAEHVSRSGSAIAGYAQSVRVNEPGRMLWTRLDYRY